MLTKGGPSGGSNGLQMVQFFFCELFMIFVHKKKSLHRKLEKSDFLEHPNPYHGAKRSFFTKNQLPSALKPV